MESVTVAAAQRLPHMFCVDQQKASERHTQSERKWLNRGDARGPRGWPGAVGPGPGAKGLAP